MAVVIVLATDWDDGDDPINYYGTDPDGCLDFNSQPAKPRSVLTLSGRKTLPDCEHGVEYDVVVCQVNP